VYLSIPRHILLFISVLRCQSTVSVADDFDPVVYGGKPWALQASSQDNTLTTFHGYAHASGRYFCLLTGLVSVPGVCK